VKGSGLSAFFKSRDSLLASGSKRIDSLFEPEGFKAFIKDH
jgi:hypothetical protein